MTRTERAWVAASGIVHLLMKNTSSDKNNEKMRRALVE